MANSTIEVNKEAQNPVFKTDTDRKIFDREQGQRILEDYAEKEQREILLGNRAEAQFVIPALKHVVVPQEPIQEPDPGWKERRERRKRRQRNLKQGIKYHSPYATCYTVPIIQYMENPAPAQDNDTFEELKKRVFARRLNANVFDKDYLGEHYAQIRGEMDELQRLLDVYKENAKPEYREYARNHPLNDVEKAKVRKLSLVFDAMNDALDATLAMHCFRKTDEGSYRVSNQPVDRATEETYEQKKQLLRELIAGSDEAETEALFANMLEKTAVPAEDVTADLAQEIKDYDYTKHYHENKDLINRILTDIRKIRAAHGSIAREWTAWDDTLRALRQDGAGNNDPRVIYATNRKDRLHPRVLAYSNRNRDLSSVFRHFLHGSLNSMNRGEWELFTGYGFKAPAHLETGSEPELVAVRRKEELRLYHEACERYCARPENKEMAAKYREQLLKIYNLRYDHFHSVAMAMKEDDEAYNEKLIDLMIRSRELRSKETKDDHYKNSEEGKKEYAAFAELAEPVIAPLINAALEYKHSDPMDYTNDDLITRQRELYDLTRALNMVKVIMKYPSTIPGVSILDKLLGRPVPKEGAEANDLSYQVALEKFKMRDDVFFFKMRNLIQLRIQSHFAALLTEEAARIEDPLPLLMTEGELPNVKKKYSGATPQETLVNYAKKKLAVAIAECDDLEDWFIDVSHASGQKESYTATYLKNNISRMEKAEFAPYMPGYLPPVHEGPEIIQRCADRIAGLKKNDPTYDKASDLEACKALYREAVKGDDKEAMVELAVYAKLVLSPFRIGVDGKILSENPMFGDFVSSDSISSIRAMDKETYTAMLSNLSAGVFLDPQSSKEEITRAKEANKQGLRTYYDTIYRHYEMVEKKYGYGRPDAYWALLHLDDVTTDQKNIAMDRQLIENDREVLDEQNPKDARLIHLVRYYDHYFYSITNILAVNMSDCNLDRQAMDRHMDLVSNDLAYLTTHPQQI